MELTFVVPSHNNLRHLKNLYTSVKKHAPDCKLVFLDDASTDGTYEWLLEIAKTDANVYEPYRSEDRVGHTILYDVGIDIAQEEVVGILHADMIVGPNYVQNLLKHLKPKTVVCGTRVEPPLHPPGREKIIMNFGMDFDDLNVEAFDKFAIETQAEFKDKVTYGMFAPWIIRKEDFVAMGGHDALFAPFPYEDSDIFQRWILSGYRLIQSRDAFVYHLTCRGHRWGEQVGKDDDYFVAANARSAMNYIRKWGSWIQNDEYHHPIVSPKYSIGLRLKNFGDAAANSLLSTIEPYLDDIRTNANVSEYIQSTQDSTPYNLSEKIKSDAEPMDNEIEIIIDYLAASQSPVPLGNYILDVVNLQSTIRNKQLEMGDYAQLQAPIEFNTTSLKVKINRFDSKLTPIVSSETKRKFYVNDRLMECVKPVIKNVF